LKVVNHFDKIYEDNYLEGKMKKIKVGIIATGRTTGGKHLPWHKNVEDVSVVVAYDVIEERGKNE